MGGATATAGASNDMEKPAHKTGPWTNMLMQCIKLLKGASVPPNCPRNTHSAERDPLPKQAPCSRH